MKISEIPNSFDEVQSWQKAYIEEHMVYAQSNKNVMDAFIEAGVSLFPKFTQFAVKPLAPKVLAVLAQDNELMKAVGIAAPSKLVSLLVETVLRLKARFEIHINVWQVLDFESSFLRNSFRTYPNGYQITDLGPHQD